MLLRDGASEVKPLIWTGEFTQALREDGWTPSPLGAAHIQSEEVLGQGFSSSSEEYTDRLYFIATKILYESISKPETVSEQLKSRGFIGTTTKQPWILLCKR